jgi:MFS family permease
MAFLAIYASRIGASGMQVGFLTAGPALANLLISLPAGQWLEGKHLIRVSFLSAVLYRLGYLAMIPLPWLFSESHQIWALILISLAMSVPGAVLAIAFNAMFADVVPPDWRAEVVGKRNALVAITITASSLICGQLLDHIVFPLNYQIVFALGALGAMLSTYHVGRIQTLTTQILRLNQPLHDFARPGLFRFIDGLRRPVGLRFLARTGGRPLVRLDLLNGPFGPFLISFFLFYTFQYIPIPLFPLVFVRELHLSDGAISLGSALFYLAMLLISLRLSRLSERFGHRNVLVYSGLVYCLYPLLNGLARDATLFWIASMVGGGVWALTNGGLINRLLERVPEGDRPAHMALHNIALNLGILSGSLLGPWLGEWIGLKPALLISAGLRLVGGLLLGLWA